jgi:hypothetical protein
LFLLDETVDIEKFKKNNFSYIKIISTDIISHHILSDLKISHNVIEDYINHDEEISINNTSQKIATTWYDDKSLEEVLTYNDFNFGKAIETPIHRYLLENIKLLVGIKNILETEKPSEIHLSPKLLHFAQFFNKVNFKEIKNSEKSKKALDKLPKPISIGKTTNLWIPRNIALKSAKLIESFLTSTFNLKLDPKNSTFDETILFLDLNPRPYESLLQQCSKLEKNTVFLKDGGTVLWNKTNLDILRNTNSKIIGLNDFATPTLISKIENQQEEFLKNFKTFISDFHPSNFQFNNFDIWKPLKNEFLKICFAYFKNGILIYELTKIFLREINVKSILMLYNMDFIQQIFIHFSENLNIPCYRLQHGLDPLNQYLVGLQPMHLPKHQNINHLVWSKMVKKYLIDNNVVKEKNLVSIGNPRYDKLFNSKNGNKITGKILLTSSFTYTGFDLSGYDSKRSEHHRILFENSCKILNNIPEKKLIVKLHPGAQQSYDVQKILNKVNPTIPVYKSQNVIELLKNCDVLVNMGYSTTLLEAMILQIPTISIMTNSSWYYDDEIIVNGITKSVKTPEELECAINSVFNDSNFRENLIQKGNDFVKKYLSNPGNASEKLIESL